MKDFGVLVPIVTPCSKAGKIDKKGLISVARHMVSAGCGGFLAAGSTGRGPWFNRIDRATICRIVAEECKGNIPVLAGCMAPGMEDMLEMARMMKDAGAYAAVVTPPGYFNYNQKELENIFLQFAERCPMPVLIYDIPAFTGVKLDTGVIVRLSKHGNIIGFKDSSSDIERFKEILRTLSHRDKFYLFQGKENLLAEALLAGASGIVVSLLHINVHLFTGLYRAVKQGEKDQIQKLQQIITGLMKIISKSFERCPETSTLFHFLGYMLKKQGLCENITMAHEGECPKWLAEKAEEALRLSIFTKGKK